MRFVVCWKQVVDTAARLEVRPGRGDPHAPGALPVANPYDEFALEAALRLRDELAAAGGARAEVVLLCATDEPSEDVHFHGLAMGADRARIIRLPRGARPDPLATARTLAPALEELAPDLVCCGETAVDDGAGVVGPALAALLDVPQACGVEAVSARADGAVLRVRARAGDHVSLIELALPAVVSCVRGPELPRYPSLDDIFSAGAKPVDEGPAAVAAGATRLVRRGLATPREARRGEIVGGPDPATTAEALLDRIGAATDVLTQTLADAPAAAATGREDAP